MEIIRNADGTLVVPVVQQRQHGDDDDATKPTDDDATESHAEVTAALASLDPLALSPSAMSPPALSTPALSELASRRGPVPTLPGAPAPDPSAALAAAFGTEGHADTPRPKRMPCGRYWTLTSSPSVSSDLSCVLT